MVKGKKKLDSVCNWCWHFHYFVGNVFWVSTPRWASCVVLTYPPYGNTHCAVSSSEFRFIWSAIVVNLKLPFSLFLLVFCFYFCVHFLFLLVHKLMKPPVLLLHRHSVEEINYSSLVNSNKISMWVRIYSTTKTFNWPRNKKKSEARGRYPNFNILCFSKHCIILTRLKRKNKNKWKIQVINDI